MRRDVAIVVAAGVLALMPAMIGDYWVGLLTQALIVGGVAASLDLTIGFAGLPSLGHAAFFGSAGYVTALLSTKQGIDPILSGGIAVVATVVLAALIAPFVTRLKGLGFITVTLAFGQVVWGVAIRGGSATGGENGIPAIPRPLLPGDVLANRAGFYWVTLGLVAVVLIVTTRLARSPFGLSLVGIRDAPRRTTAIGYRATARKSTAFVISAAFGAVLGAWFAFLNQFVGPSALDWRQSATFLLAVVVGGSATIWGPFVAGAGLQIVETTLTGQTSVWPMVLGILYVFTVLVIPDGIGSIPSRLREMTTRATPMVPESLHGP